jgi:hypothetical protein
VLRAIAIAHFFLAALLIPMAIGSAVHGIRFWTESVRDLEVPVRHPETIAAKDRFSALVQFAFSLGALLVAGSSMAIGSGLWRFFSWPGRLATGQGLFVLAIGFLIGLYILFSYGDPSGGGWMIPGFILFLVAGFIRSRRSRSVCSESYRKARAVALKTAN